MKKLLLISILLLLTVGVWGQSSVVPPNEECILVKANDVEWWLNPRGLAYYNVAASDTVEIQRLLGAWVRNWADKLGWIIDYDYGGEVYRQAPPPSVANVVLFNDCGAIYNFYISEATGLTAAITLYSYARASFSTEIVWYNIVVFLTKEGNGK